MPGGPYDTAATADAWRFFDASPHLTTLTDLRLKSRKNGLQWWCAVPRIRLVTSNSGRTVQNQAAIRASIKDNVVDIFGSDTMTIAEVTT